MIILLISKIVYLTKLFLYCRGVWNVPYISTAYLINATLLQTDKPNYDAHELDPDMSFSRHYRDKVTNLTFLYLYMFNTFDGDLKRIPIWWKCTLHPFNIISAFCSNIFKLQRSGFEVMKSSGLIFPLYAVIHPNFHPTGYKMKINLSLLSWAFNPQNSTLDIDCQKNCLVTFHLCIKCEITESCSYHTLLKN